MVGAGALQEKNRSFVAGAGEFLQSGERHEDPGAFSVFHDTGDVKIVLQHAQRLAHFDVLGARRPIIHEQVIRAVHIAPLKKDEPAGDRAKAFRIDTVDDVDAPGGIELQQNRSDRLHVSQLPQAVGDTDGHWRAAECEEDRSRRGLQHDIRAYAFDALGRFLHHPAGQAHDNYDQSDLDTDGQNAHHGPQRPMQNIRQNDAYDHGWGSCCPAPKFTSSVPAGCMRLKRSAGIPVLRASLVMTTES